MGSVSPDGTFTVGRSAMGADSLPVGLQIVGRPGSGTSPFLYSGISPGFSSDKFTGALPFQAPARHSPGVGLTFPFAFVSLLPLYACAEGKHS